MQESRIYTKLEVTIQDFIAKYSVDELIKWISEYNKIISKSDFNMFHRIQRFTCETYDIPIADISKASSTNMDKSDAKKTISYLTHRHTKLQQKHLTMLQSCTTRTIYNHIRDVNFRVSHPEGWRKFIEKLTEIEAKILNHDTNT